MPPLVSVGVPLYNGARTLRRALDSLERQTFTDWEALVFDNASTDDTAAIVAEYAARDPRFRVHRHPTNIGALRNFRAAFTASASRYFVWLAHDDWWDERFLEVAVTKLLEADGDLAVPTTFVVDDDAHELYRNSVPEADEPAGWIRRIFAEPTAHWIYGVHRRTSLAPPLDRYGRRRFTWGNDVILLVELVGNRRVVGAPRAIRYATSKPSSYAPKGQRQIWAWRAWYAGNVGAAFAKHVLRRRDLPLTDRARLTKAAARHLYRWCAPFSELRTRLAQR